MMESGSREEEMGLEILVVPYDVERRDTPTARGPRGLLEHGFAGRLREMGWAVGVTEVAAPEGASKLATVTAIGCHIAAGVERARAQGRLPVILSGGCLASLGVVAGLQRGGCEVAVVWVDAHGDVNTPETSTSGYWDGMSLAALRGDALPEVREGIGLRPLEAGAAVHLGGRAFDPREGENVARLGLITLPAERVADAGSLATLRRCAAGRELYLHVDVDGLDPRDAPAVGFAEPDGIRLEQLLRCRSALCRPAALTLSALGFDRAAAAGAERTTDACVRLVAAFGAR
jgi:arginase